jgi:hypothetical protein
VDTTGQKRDRGSGLSMTMKEGKGAIDKSGMGLYQGVLWVGR